MYITVNKTDDGDIFEVFTNASGGSQSDIATITRLTSLALRSGVSVRHIIRQLSVSKDSASEAMIKAGRKDISLSVAMPLPLSSPRSIMNPKRKTGRARIPPETGIQ